MTGLQRPILPQSQARNGSRIAGVRVLYIGGAALFVQVVHFAFQPVTQTVSVLVAMMASAAALCLLVPLGLGLLRETRPSILHMSPRSSIGIVAFVVGAGVVLFVGIPSMFPAWTRFGDVFSWVFVAGFSVVVLQTERVAGGWFYLNRSGVCFLKHEGPRPGVDGATLNE